MIDTKYFDDKFNEAFANYKKKAEEALFADNNKVEVAAGDLLLFCSAVEELDERILSKLAREVFCKFFR